MQLLLIPGESLPLLTPSSAPPSLSPQHPSSALGAWDAQSSCVTEREGKDQTPGHLEVKLVVP